MMSYSVFTLKIKKNAYLDFIQGDNEGHLDLPRMKLSGFHGGFFSLFMCPRQK